MPKTTKTFDKQAYDREFQREHYKKLTGTFTKEEAEQVQAAAAAEGLTVSKYIKVAVFARMNKGN